MAFSHGMFWSLFPVFGLKERGTPLGFRHQIVQAFCSLIAANGGKKFDSLGGGFLSTATSGPRARA
jgi:hypothetical protein